MILQNTTYIVWNRTQKHGIISLIKKLLQRVSPTNLYLTIKAIIILKLRKT